MVAPSKIWNMQDHKLKRFAKDLELFGAKDFPKINGSALNKSAFEAKKEAVRIAEIRFTLRNKWTIRSIQFEKVKGLQPRTQFSVVGSTMDYMADQEFGAKKTKSGKKGIAIPSTTASGESIGARPRKKAVMKSRLRSRIKLSKSSIRARNRKQHIVSVIRSEAAKGSGRFVYLPIENASGIYRITGKGKRAKIKLIYDLSRSFITIEKKPWLQPAVNNIVPKIPRYYLESFEKITKKRFRF